MDYEKLLAALIAQGSHTGGHFVQAETPDDPMRDAPVGLDVRHMIETGMDSPDNWQAPKKGDLYAGLRMSHADYLADKNRKEAELHGAGFEFQDKIRNMIEDPELQKSVSVMNALIKAGFLAGAVDKVTQGKASYKGGDVGALEKTSGNRHTKDLVMASALYDLYKSRNPGGDVSFGFDVIDGAPGARATLRW